MNFSFILLIKFMKNTVFLLVLFFAFIFSLPANANAQTDKTGNVLRGRITINSSGGAAAPNAAVTITQLKRVAQSDENGNYEFTSVPAGKYDVIIHLDHTPDVLKMVEIGGDTTLDFQLTLSSIREQVTVTASGTEEATANSYQPVTTVSALEIAERNPISLGEALDNQPGIAKRSFGPGSARPVIRGFDNDRVLVLKDGLRIGGIASQSSDEAEPLDVLGLDRIEVVKGPATLLYGSNAIGGVVNGIGGNDVYQKGLSGYLTAFGGTNNWQAGGNAGLKYGFRNFMFWAGGGGQKANDYRTPIGTVLNSFARSGSFSGGGGWFSRKGWISADYSFDRQHYGIPVEPGAIDFEFLKSRRHSYQIKGGLRELGKFVEGGNFSFNYNDYINREFEFESDENKTEFESLATNKNYNYRATFDQKRRGKLSGIFGFSGFSRKYESVGKEAPAPFTKQNSTAIFALEKLDFERIGFQFGGRVEKTGYKPEGNFPQRDFVGFSGGAAVRLPLWTGGSFVVNYQHAFRALSIEELYNFGPHPGNLVFDIGDPNLKAEQSDNIDFLLRHNTDRFRLESGVYFYKIKNFVYLAYNGERDNESGLPIALYKQGDSHFVGTEARFDAKILRPLWFESQIDYVRAELTDLNKSLPRIPPLRAKVGLNWVYKNLNVRPEIVLANRQNRVYDNESPTAGYTVLNLNASYSFVVNRMSHIFSVNAYNLGNKLYRNHLSYIKDFAPEIGRGVRFSYVMRF